MARASIEELQAQSEKLDRALAKRGVSDKDIITELPDTCARLKEMGQVRLSYVDYSCDRSIVCAGSNAAYRGTPRAAKTGKIFICAHETEYFRAFLLVSNEIPQAA